MLILEIGQMLATTADKSSVLCPWYFNCQYNAVAQISDKLLQLGFKLVDKFRVTTKADLIRRVALSGAIITLG